MRFNKLQTVILISILSTLSILLAGGRFFLAYIETGNEQLFRYIPSYDPIQAYKYFYQGNSAFHESFKETLERTDQISNINTAIESYMQSYSLLHMEETLMNLEAANRRKKQLEGVNDTHKGQEEQGEKSAGEQGEKSQEKHEKKEEKHENTEARENSQQKQKNDTRQDGNTMEEGKKGGKNGPDDTSLRKIQKGRTGFTNSGMLQQIGNSQSMTGSGMELRSEDRNALLKQKKELEKLQTEKNTYIRPDGKIETNSDLGHMFEQFFGKNIIQSPKNEDPEDY